MMPIPKDIKSVEAMFLNKQFADSADYWFSYRNKSGEFIDILKGVIRISRGPELVVISTKEITSVDNVVPTNLHADESFIRINHNGTKTLFAADTVSQGKYLDIFPVVGAIRRRVVLDNKD